MFHSNIPKHENILELLGYIESPNFAMIMPLCDGTLSSLIFSRDIFENYYPVMAKAATDIAKGFELIHSLGIIHSDLKPDNILFVKSKDSFIFKISDFGVIIKLSNTNLC